MAEKKAPTKSSSSSSTAKPKAAKPEEKSTTAAAAPAKAVAQKAKTTDAPVAVVAPRGICVSEGCKHPLRAKGYCRKHFLAWRRGKLGAHHHYKTCSHEACRKKREFGGLCAEHAGKTDAGAAAPAAAS
jgi:hypothetical protein